MIVFLSGRFVSHHLLLRYCYFLFGVFTIGLLACLFWHFLFYEDRFRLIGIFWRSKTTQISRKGRLSQNVWLGFDTAEFGSRDEDPFITLRCCSLIPVLFFVYLTFICRYFLLCSTFLICHGHFVCDAMVWRVFEG